MSQLFTTQVAYLSLSAKYRKYNETVRKTLTDNHIWFQELSHPRGKSIMVNSTDSEKAFRLILSIPLKTK